MADKFSFEDLKVWSKSIDFCNEIISVIDCVKTTRQHYRLFEQLEACASSVSANIAEGSGRYSKKEFIQFLYIARGSLYESINFLIIFERRKWITSKKLDKLKQDGIEIAKMISSLIKSIKLK